MLLNCLMKISTEISSTTELDVLLPNVAGITSDYLNVHSTSVMLTNKENSEIDCYSCNEPHHSSFPLQDDVIKNVIHEGSEYIYNRKSLSDGNDKSLLVFPLKIAGKVLGVFVLTDKNDNYFTDDDITISRYIAGQCALALERHEMHDKMKTHEHLQLIGLLKSSVFHDISNLLAVADVYIGLIEEEVDKSSEMFEYIERVKNEIKHVSILTTDMLDLSKDKIIPHRTRFTISELIDELKLYSTAYAKNYNIEIEYIIKYNGNIMADKNKLFRVFFNLLNNAGEAAKEDGKILFSVKETGSDVSFLVADNGKGIRREDIGKLFQPFYTSGKVKGTGIGLAIVYDIVEAHSGSIRVRSKLGSYTCFLVRIPKDG